MKKIVVCNEPARSDDFACDTCGGDIRGNKCCTKEFCTIEEVPDEAK